MFKFTTTTTLVKLLFLKVFVCQFTLIPLHLSFSLLLSLSNMMSCRSPFIIFEEGCFGHPLVLFCCYFNLGNTGRKLVVGFAFLFPIIFFSRTCCFITLSKTFPLVFQFIKLVLINFLEIQIYFASSFFSFLLEIYVSHLKISIIHVSNIANLFCNFILIWLFIRKVFLF